MAGTGQVARIYPATGTSKVVVEVGSEIPSEKVGEETAKVQDVSALIGFSLTEPGEGEAKVRLYDGKSAANGSFLATIPLAKGANSTITYSYPVDLFNGAVYLEVVVGKVEGVVLYG